MLARMMSSRPRLIEGLQVFLDHGPQIRWISGAAFQHRVQGAFGGAEVFPHQVAQERPIVPATLDRQLRGQRGNLVPLPVGTKCSAFSPAIPFLTKGRPPTANNVQSPQDQQHHTQYRHNPLGIRQSKPGRRLQPNPFRGEPVNAIGNQIQPQQFAPKDFLAAPIRDRHTGQQVEAAFMGVELCGVTANSVAEDPPPTTATAIPPPRQQPLTQHPHRNTTRAATLSGRATLSRAAGGSMQAIRSASTIK